MTENLGQPLALETIAKAAQIVAAQVSLEGVAMVLLNASLELSGAARGAVVFATEGDLRMNASGFEPGLPLVAKLKPDGELTDLPMGIFRSVVEGRAPHVRRLGGNGSSASLVCMPAVSGDALRGLLYLEFDDAQCEVASERINAVALLASHAAMALDAFGDFGTQRHSPAWRDRGGAATNVASFRWNPATRLSTGSREYYDMLGFDPERGPIDFVSMTSRLFPADYPAAQAVIDDVVRRQAPLRIEFRIVHPSGDIRSLLWSGQFELTGTATSELVGVVMDVTDLRAVDDHLRTAHEDAERQLRLAWLGEMAGSIVHEVNQPLGAIVSSAEAALRWLERDDPDVDAAVASVERIVEIARRAGRTVAELRSMSSDRFIEVVDRSLNSIVGEALQMSVASLGRFDIRTEIAFDPERPMVSVNPAQLLQVMLNLINNAVDSMREIAERPRVLSIRTTTDSDMAVAEVGDTGVGLPADAGRVFDPLFTTKKDGMGLGLSICRRVVLAHGGTIAARSNPEFGATLILCLPKAVSLLRLETRSAPT